MIEVAPNPPRFSVIVASRDRPQWLSRCLLSLRQQVYPEFEVIVVADPASVKALSERDLKVVPFDQANLGAARNLGVQHAAGDFCAFIDDDSAAEPLWLARLAEAEASTQADAIVGFVRGRNGISFQSRVSSIDAEAETHEETELYDEPWVPRFGEGKALKLIGTNMAVRRTVLETQGGFDPNFRFYLDDTDISLRLARQGYRMAASPYAQVHHGFAASPRRTRLRAPLDLFDIGRSTSYYVQKHLGHNLDEIWDRLERRERRRLMNHMIQGTCEPSSIAERLKQLEEGWRDGLSARPAKALETNLVDRQFKNCSKSAQSPVILGSKWISQRKKLKKSAEGSATAGIIANVFSFSLTNARHRVRYTNEGYWLQTGGLFGKSDRDGPFYKWCRFADRLKSEIQRVAKSRGIGDAGAVSWWDHTR